MNKPLLAVLLFVAALAPAAPAAAPRIVVFKAERRLEFQQDGRIVKTCRVGLGTHPAGHKLRQGDGRTPEGIYYVCVKNAHSQYYLSLGLSYPSSGDAARAVAAGAITQGESTAIARANRNRSTPPWNTALGGEIFIHGHGSGSDWTLGCIALDDADMKELFNLVSKGTAVEVRP
jgi:murein L,D-transpeptidase YafK